MRKSTTSFLFPDLNVWLALSHDGHVHHAIAREWFEAIAESARVCFCRLTQIGLLRLLTTEAIMNTQVLTQTQAWHIYDRWLEDGRVTFAEEPATIEPMFRAASQMKRAAPKDWADSYLIAFAQSAGFQLVTFDRSLHRKAEGALLLL